MKLASNRELYDYLVSLALVLKNREAEGLGQFVTEASRHSVGMSTEFLGEARIALRRVERDKNGVLNVEEHAELLDILEQLDIALDRR